MRKIRYTGWSILQIPGKLKRYSGVVVYVLLRSKEKIFRVSLGHFCASTYFFKKPTQCVS